MSAAQSSTAVKTSQSQTADAQAAAPVRETDVRDFAPVAGPHNSPAHRLAMVSEQLWLAETEPRWSTRKTWAFIAVTCGGFWLGVGVLAFQFLG